MEQYQSTEHLKQATSKLSARTPCVSILTLSQSVLEDIVTFVRKSIFYDGYLCELRLVNRRFNEAVMHCLCFRDSRRAFYPSHYMSCPTEEESCRKISCRSVGYCNHVYARYRLQASIQMSRRKGQNPAGYQATLAKALDLLRDHLKSQETLSVNIESHIKNASLFGCSSVNPVFSDSSSIIFCEATLGLLKIDSREWYDGLRADHELSCLNASFWLRNLACFFGDIDMYTFYCPEAQSSAPLHADLVSELPYLLATTAARGHQALFEHIMCRALPQHTDLRLALRGAWFSGNLQITNIIIQACSTNTLARLCSESLRGCHRVRPLPPNYSRVAEQVLSSCGQIPTNDLSIILLAQAELGSPAVVQLLLKQYPNRALWPFARNLQVASLSALWSACVNGDLQCVRILIRDGFFAKMEEDEIRRLCRWCIPAACQANSFQICQELCEFIGKDINTLSFEVLAGVDGSVGAMKKRLEIKPNGLGVESRLPEGPLIGQVALRRAVQLLRVENTRFLLERGVRLHGTYKFEPLAIDWRRKRAYEQKFREVQQLLQESGLAQLEVRL